MTTQEESRERFEAPPLPEPGIPPEPGPTPDTYTPPKHGWTCFHCGETFKTIGGAADHFGAKPTATPGCLVRVQFGDERGLEMALRKVESERDELLEALKRCREESARTAVEADRAVYEAPPLKPKDQDHLAVQPCMSSDCDRSANEHSRAALDRHAWIGPNRCHSDQEGDCDWHECPQHRDSEPETTGRSCPLWRDHEDEEVGVTDARFSRFYREPQAVPVDAIGPSSTAKERSLESALLSALRAYLNEYEGVYDSVSASGQPYQSESARKAEEAARAAVAEALRSNDQSNSDQGDQA